MDQDHLPAADAVAAEAARLRLGVDPFELHGSLCGLVCGGGRATPTDWLRQLAIDSDPGTAPAADGALAQLYTASQQQLADSELGFDRLQPDEDAPLDVRAEALLAWCRGFLGGFGLASAAQPPLSDEAAEALDDLGRIAQTSLSYEDPDSDEEALAEIGEFVRVAALLLYAERHRDGALPSLH